MGRITSDVIIGMSVTQFTTVGHIASGMLGLDKSSRYPIGRDAVRISYRVAFTPFERRKTL